MGGTRVGATHAWIEDVPSGRAFNIPQLAELRGFIRSELMRECRLFVERSNQSSARKLFLGALPQKDRKAAVVVTLDSITGIFGSNDEKDAFVSAANWGLSELGAPCIALPAPESVKKPRKRAA